MTPFGQLIETGLLDRAGWLKAHGFYPDPFMMRSFRGESDPVLQRAFIPFADVDFERIKGAFTEEGYSFVFASAGAGKSSLRVRIKNELEPVLDFSGKRILVVEYTDHSYDRAKSNVLSHAIRLRLLIERALANRNAGRVRQGTGAEKPLTLYKQSKVRWRGTLAGEFKASRSAPDCARALLEDVLIICQAQGFDVVCILVDVDSPWDDKKGAESAFERILPLARQSDLFDIRGLIFKFLLPLEYKATHGPELSKDKYPLYEIRWDSGSLRKALVERLVACQDESIQDPRSTCDPQGFSLLAQLCNRELYTTIEEEFINFGLARGCPRAMWQLGYYLLEEHFNLSPNARRRRRDELIERSALDSAYGRLSKEIPSVTRSEARKACREACMQMKTWIAQGTISALKEALKLFRSYAESAAIAMEARLNRVSWDYHSGLVERDKYDVTLNSVIEDLLLHIERISDDR